MSTDPARPDGRDPNPRPDARRLGDYVAVELAHNDLSDDEPAPKVRRTGEPMPPSRVTPEYRRWLQTRGDR